jgi:hypothetical protein
MFFGEKDVPRREICHIMPVGSPLEKSGKTLYA